MPFLRTASLNQACSQQHPKALVLSTSWRRYAQRVCSLGAFSYYCGADELAARGGTALLQAELSRVLLPGLAAARRSGDISRCVCAALCPVQIRDSTLTRCCGVLWSVRASLWVLRHGRASPCGKRLAILIIVGCGVLTCTPLLSFALLMHSGHPRMHCTSALPGCPLLPFPMLQDAFFIFSYIIHMCGDLWFEQR